MHINSDTYIHRPQKSFRTLHSLFPANCFIGLLFISLGYKWLQPGPPVWALLPSVAPRSLHSMWKSRNIGDFSYRGLASGSPKSCPATPENVMMKGQKSLCTVTTWEDRAQASSACLCRCQQQPQLHGFQVCITKQSWPNRVWFSEASGLWEVLLLGQAILFPRDDCSYLPHGWRDTASSWSDLCVSLFWQV